MIVFGVYFKLLSTVTWLLFLPTEKLFDAVVPLFLFMGPLWAYAGVLDKSHREYTSKVSKTIHFIGFLIYFVILLVVVLADMNYSAQIGLSAFCCPLGMCLLVLRNKTSNCCLHSGNDAGLSIVRTPFKEGIRTVEDVPMETNDQPTKADRSSFNITARSMGVPDAHFGEDSD